MYADSELYVFRWHSNYLYNQSAFYTGCSSLPLSNLFLQYRYRWEKVLRMQRNIKIFDIHRPRDE